MTKASYLIFSNLMIQAATTIATKAVGLAKFAEKHWDLFDRIQLIRKKKASDGKEHYFRLDVGKESVRKKVLRITSNDTLDLVFDEEAKAQ